MGRSRRKYKKSRQKVQVGLPRKKPHVFKPAFSVPDALRCSEAGELRKWDEEGSVVRNYKQFGVVSNPNLLGASARTPQILQCAALQVPSPSDGNPIDEFEPIDSGSDLESDDLKSALGKRRRDGKHAPPQPLTTIQRVYIGRLIEKYDDDYQAMFRDITLNAMQHSVGTLRKLCQRYHLIAPHTSKYKLRKTDGTSLSGVSAAVGGELETS